MMKYFNQQIVLIFILLALGKSLSHARQVKEITVVTTEKKLAMDGVSNSINSISPKEILPNASKVETSVKIGGRKMTSETTTKASKEQGRNSKKVSMASSSSSSSSSSAGAAHSVGNRKVDEEKNLKDNFMAFSADYRSPKPHPPKNN